MKKATVSPKVIDSAIEVLNQMSAWADWRIDDALCRQLAKSKVVIEFYERTKNGRNLKNVE